MENETSSKSFNFVDWAKKHRVATLGLGGLVLIVLVSMATGQTGSVATDTLQSPAVGKEDAALMAEGFVKNYLKAPSTAKFPNLLDMQVIDLGSGMFAVSSYVDSQNGFGAMLRSEWTARLEYLGGEKQTWQLDGLEIGGTPVFERPPAPAPSPAAQ